MNLYQIFLRIEVKQQLTVAEAPLEALLTSGASAALRVHAHILEQQKPLPGGSVQYASDVGATGSLGGSMVNAPVSGIDEPISSRTVLSITPSDFIVSSHVLCAPLVGSSEPSVSLC